MQRLIYLLFSFIIGATNAIIGYDCGSKSLNMTTISLLDIDDCNIEEEHVEVSKLNLYLLQINDFEHVEIKQCKVEISRTVHHCGMHSHVSIVNNAYMDYVHSMTREACQIAHDHGTLRIANAVIDGVLLNTTTIRSITFAGSSTDNGACSGAQYSDPYGTWNSVVVMGTVRISLRSATVRVKTDINKVYMPSGFTCNLNSGMCVDPEGGFTFWDQLPRRFCSSTTYSMIYRGLAEKLKTKKETIYTVQSKDTTFSLSVLGAEDSCGLNLLKTEHPKLFIAVGTSLGRIEATNAVNTTTDNMDIFLYINTKFIYVERYIRRQLQTLYHDVMMHRCKLEREVLQNSLAIASTQPDEFAYRFMKGPGFMAVLAGEVIHIVQCVPVEVKIQHAQTCYNKIPILRNNQSYFLTPKTHIITQHAVQIPCNSPLLQYYQVGQTWYKFMPKPVETAPPTILKPDSKVTWEYKNPVHMATSGIYTPEDLETMRNRIMFTMEQTAILETVAEKAIKGSHSNKPSLYNLLDEESLEKIAKSAWEKTWGKFVTFGTVSAGFIGLFVAFRICKLIVDTIVHAYTLHTVYGWSIKLIGALWDSITHLLVHLAQRETERNTLPNVRMSEINHDQTEDNVPDRNSTSVYPNLPQSETQVTRIFVN